MAPGANIEEWLRDDDTASVVSGVSRVAASEYDVFDDSKYFLEDEVDKEAVVDAEEYAVVSDLLGEVARGAQRKTVCGFYNHYDRGRMLDFPDYGKREVRKQKYFRLESYVQLTSLDDQTLVNMLMNGVVRTRLSAQTGVGKTMKLPGLVASKCGIRVCQVELDTPLSKDALSYQRQLYKIPGGVKAWSRQRKAFLTVMSYSEFRGIVLSGNRERLFQDFDLFYFDEASEPLARVWVARQYFAEFAQEHNSLAVVSATASTQEENNVTSTGMGKFAVEPQFLSLRDALDSGRLLREHLYDRTLLLVASDEDVALARTYYLEHGIDVCILDSASTRADRGAVVKKLSAATSVVPRVLVAVETFGTGVSFPVSYVISTCTRRVYEMNDTNSLEEREVPLMGKSVLQHQGRANRGLTSSSGGWLLSPDRVVDKELLPSEALEAYLSLVAAGITPRPGLFDTVARVLPKGIDAGVARMLLRVGLPPALAVRYLGSDGRFSSKYVDGVRLFSQGGEVLRKSKDLYPVGYEKWVEESVGEYFEGDDGRSSVLLKVPFPSPAGLKVQMHAISAVAESLLDLEYWDWFDEAEESDDEEIGVRAKVKRTVKPRMPEAPGLVFEDVSVTSGYDPWAYDADPAAVAKRSRRKGMSWAANGEGKAAITTLLRAVANDGLGVSVARPEVDVPEHGGKVVYSLPLDEGTMVPVKSPGGGRILLVSKSIHECFMSGSVMSEDQVREILSHLVELKAVERFVKSTVFDNWSPAWLCWLGSCSDVAVMQSLKVSGMHSDVVKLVNFMYERFRTEMLTVAASSNLYKDKLAGFVRSKPSVSRFVSAVRKGKLPVAQSEDFVSRVCCIKDAYDKAVMAFEQVGVFAPELVTKAQAKLPIRDRNRRMPVIDESVVGGKSVGTLREEEVWRR